MHWGDGYGWMGGGWIFMAFFWILIIIGIVTGVRWLSAGASRGESAQRRTPLEILDERYARGEIERDEYEQKRRDLDA